jgi:hypothetical protein
MTCEYQKGLATVLATLKAAFSFLKNKTAMILILCVSGWLYTKYLRYTDNVPFVEVVYASLTAGWVFILAPLLRLLVFPEAAEYAESGQLRKDINLLSGTTPGLTHYRFATAVCFITVLLCICTIPK